MGHVHGALGHAPAALDVLGFVMLGLLGGFGHCAGMCSPFVFFVSRRYTTTPQPRSVLSAQLWYTAGRLAMYSILGAIAGALGGLVQIAGTLLGLQRGAAILAGGVLVLWALASLFDLSGRRPRLLRLQNRDAGWFARIAAVAHSRALGHPAAMGLLLGLLPCGLLYSALIAASARGTPLTGALGLAVFGLGTTPALFGVALADTLLARNRAALNRLSQAFALVMGAWFLWRGVMG